MRIQNVVFILLVAWLCAHCASLNRTSSNGSIRSDIVEYGRKHVGSKYKYAGRSAKGFDCSGFTHFVFGAHQVHLTPVSREQGKLGKKIKVEDAKAGDLLFFGKGSKIDHVALISSNRRDRLMIIHSTSSLGVIEENVWDSKYWRNRLLFARDVLSDL